MTQPTDPTLVDATEAAPVQAYELTGFSTRDVPWGKLGATLPPKPDGYTSAEAAELGGMNFEVDLLPAGFYLADTRTWRRVPSRRATVRRDTQAFFGMVSKDYKPVQYREAFAFLDAINPNYVAAGTLGEGRQGFMVVELPGRATLNLELRGEVDAHQLYVVVQTSHDYSKAVEVMVMALRGKCMNALTLPSFSRAAQQRWSIRHTGNPQAKLDEALAVLSRTDAYVADLTQTATRLAAIELELDETTALLRDLLPDRPRQPEQVDAIVSRWQSAPTVGEAYHGTGWGLVNAISDYFEHGRVGGTRTPASHFTTGLTGASHRYTSRAAQRLLTRRG